MPTVPTSRTNDLVALVIVASLAILAGLGNGTFWEPDEPRFAEATRQMFARGDFVTPYLNGVPRFEKPILFYWAQATAFTAFGDNEFAARLPSAIAGVGIVLVLYLLVVEIASRRAAFVAALVMATMFRSCFSWSPRFTASSARCSLHAAVIVGGVRLQPYLPQVAHQRRGRSVPGYVSASACSPRVR